MSTTLSSSSMVVVKKVVLKAETEVHAISAAKVSASTPSFAIDWCFPLRWWRCGANKVFIVRDWRMKRVHVERWSARWQMLVTYH